MPIDRPNGPALTEFAKSNKREKSTESRVNLSIIQVPFYVPYVKEILTLMANVINDKITIKAILVQKMLLVWISQTTAVVMKH